jgi:hypothetical protein
MASLALMTTQGFFNDTAICFSHKNVLITFFSGSGLTGVVTIVEICALRYPT